MAAGRPWSALLPALRERPVAQTFVPVATCDAGGTVGVFPVIYKQWKDRHAVPRTVRRCATYLRDALALLDAQWPLRQGETLDPASPATLAAVDGALRFVIYFAERDVPPEREYEFLLAEPMLQLTRILVDGALKQKPPVDLSFDYARDAAGRRMREIRASRPFVLRTVLCAMQRPEPRAEQAFRLNLLLHDAAHVLSACEQAFIPLRVFNTTRAEGTGPRETTVRVAWPGLVEANGRLHLPLPGKAMYLTRGSVLPFVKPSTAEAGDTKSERSAVAYYNLASLDAVCRTEDLLRDAKTHRAPPLEPAAVVLPPPRTELEDILAGIGDDSGDGIVFGTL